MHQCMLALNAAEHFLFNPVIQWMQSSFRLKGKSFFYSNLTLCCSAERYNTQTESDSSFIDLWKQSLLKTGEAPSAEEDHVMKLQIGHKIL